MHGTKKRKAVAPVQQKDPETLFREQIINKTDNKNVLVSEYEVVHKQRPTPFWMRDLSIPRWLLLLLVTLAIVAVTALSVFAAIVTLKKESEGGSCKSNTDCRQDLGLMCNNYRCGCAYSHFWSDTYRVCERRRMINRTCVNDSECDALAYLQCTSVPLSSGAVESQCQCKAGMSWIINTCDFTRVHNQLCALDAHCDDTRFLSCNTVLGFCRCNASMFWNGNSGTLSGTCEYKRTVNQYCSPYNNDWCDGTGPVGQGLVCAQYVNPYGSEYGVCQCSTHQFYNGSASLANGYCVPHRLFGEPCASTSNCDYRVSLICTNSICSCPAGKNYDASINSSGVMGYCAPAAGYLQNCSAIILCSSSQSLYCDLTYYPGINVTGVCLCNTSWSFWDGITCVRKLSIGGQCTSNTHCISSDGLFCSNYTQSINQCDCDKNHYWNGTCSLKLFYNESCGTIYVCDDNRGLLCQGLGNSMFQKCDCYNGSFIWDSLYVTNRTYKCIRKLSYGNRTCYGDLECEEFNYLKCVGGQCTCDYTDYWDGGKCEPKRTHLLPCNYTYQCRDFSPVNLLCLLVSPSTSYQCRCNSTSYWEVCTQQCTVSKKRHEPCTLAGNCTSAECQVSANLQCINDSYTNVTGQGWCNCTSLQWWNGTYCKDKGTPSWGSTFSAICNATYQCADYNLVSCPLGGNYPTINSTCECATTKYWNGVTCLDRVIFGQACTSWPHFPVLTTTCLNAAGAGLLCNSASCTAGTNCTGGSCYCPGGTLWNASFLICAATSTG